jgi:hypothetical protein
MDSALRSVPYPEGCGGVKSDRGARGWAEWVRCLKLRGRVALAGYHIAFTNDRYRIYQLAPNPRASPLGPRPSWAIS